MAAAGDVNGDGIARRHRRRARRDQTGRIGAGSAYVVFGKTADTATVSLGALAAQGFRIEGAAGGNLDGTSVAGAGDLNGDGFARRDHRRPFADNGASNSGSAYVVFGRTPHDDGRPPHARHGGFRIDGAAGQRQSGRIGGGTG